MMRHCSKPLTNCVLSHTLGAMRSGSPPGSDGLEPAEFYRSFSNVVGSAFVAIFNRVVAHQRVPASFLVGRVVLLPEDPRDMRSLAAWRPITLNADYKLLSASLAKPLGAVIGPFVNWCQTFDSWVLYSY